MPLFTASSPFDSDVERATSELNAHEDWQLTREICAHASQSPAAAKDCLRSIVKRMNNVDPHVALQAIFLLEQCATHSGLSFRHEVASRDFVSECRTLITNGKTHTKVIRRLKQLVRVWAEGEFKSDPSLSLIPSLFNSLRTEGHTFPVEEITSMRDNASQREEDDLAKAIALSLEQSSKHASSSKSSLYPSVGASAGPREPRKVRALYDFEAAEDNELTFKAGEVLSVLDDSDPNWWKGSSWRGEGLFPANFVTADLTAEIEPDIPKSRKSVHFHDEVDVQLIESAPVEVFDVDEGKIDETLTLIQNADPTVENDSSELLALEDQCRSMAPLIDQELETIDRQHNVLVEVNSKLTEAFQMYHSLMQGLPGYGYTPVPGTMTVPLSGTHQIFASQSYMAVGQQTVGPPQAQYAALPPLVYQQAEYQPTGGTAPYASQTNSVLTHPQSSIVYNTPSIIGQQQSAAAANNFVVSSSSLATATNGINGAVGSGGQVSGGPMPFPSPADMMHVRGSPQHMAYQPPGGSSGAFNTVVAQNLL